MNKIKISGKYFYPEDFTENNIPDFFESPGFHKQIYLFLKEWFSPAESINLQTSGSTGKPKIMNASKLKMLNSAALTCNFFSLKENDKALLCLSTDFIAGKMMIVRSLYRGLDIYPVEPTGHPLKELSCSIEFAAMVPMQVYNSLHSEIERKKLSQIKNLIIGGGAINSELESDLKEFPNNIYSTYGMTETLSHIGLRKINGKYASEYYTPLPGVTINISEKGTLIIDIPDIADTMIVTNDIAEIKSDGTFKIIGRIDNVINTGGIKVITEELEELLQPYIKGRYAITSIPHPKLGEAIVLLVEKELNETLTVQYIRKYLPHYMHPQHIVKTSSVPLTRNGKLDRAAIKKIAEKLIN